MVDCVFFESILTILHLSLQSLRHFLELCEELRIKDVEVILRLLWNDVVLKEAEIEQNQYII